MSRADGTNPRAMGTNPRAQVRLTDLDDRLARVELTLQLIAARLGVDAPRAEGVVEDERGVFSPGSGWLGGTPGAGQLDLDLDDDPPPMTAYEAMGAARAALDRSQPKER